MKEIGKKNGICIYFENVPDKNTIEEMRKRREYIERNSRYLFILGIFCTVVTLVLIPFCVYVDTSEISTFDQYFTGMVILLIISGYMAPFSFLFMKDRPAEKIEAPRLRHTLNIYDAYILIRKFETEQANVKSTFCLLNDAVRLDLSAETKKGDIVEKEIIFPVDTHIYNAKIPQPVVDVMNRTVRIPSGYYGT